MERNEFVLATALVLFTAFCLGFAAHWVLARLTRATARERVELDRLAEALRRAEADRDAALSGQGTGEARLQSRLGQTEAELRDALDRLREARRDNEALKAALAARTAPQGRA